MKYPILFSKYFIWYSMVSFIVNLYYKFVILSYIIINVRYDSVSSSVIMVSLFIVLLNVSQTQYTIKIYNTMSPSHNAVYEFQWQFNCNQDARVHIVAYIYRRHSGTIL